jgi:hypothetical protein
VSVKKRIPGQLLSGVRPRLPIGQFGAGSPQISQRLLKTNR